MQKKGLIELPRHGSFVKKLQACDLRRYWDQEQASFMEATKLSGKVYSAATDLAIAIAKETTLSPRQVWRLLRVFLVLFTSSYRLRVAHGVLNMDNLVEMSIS